MEATQTIFGFGHKKVQATHKSTLEITKEKELSKRGDCIITVSADKGMTDLSPELKEILREDNTRIRILIEAQGIVDIVNAFGSSRLTLNHPTDIVVRKSSFVCSRTLAIKADKAAGDLSRRLVEKLRSAEQQVRITLEAKI